MASPDPVARLKNLVKELSDMQVDAFSRNQLGERNIGGRIANLHNEILRRYVLFDSVSAALSDKVVAELLEIGEPVVMHFRDARQMESAEYVSRADKVVTDFQKVLGELKERAQFYFIAILSTLDIADLEGFSRHVGSLSGIESRARQYADNASASARNADKSVEEGKTIVETARDVANSYVVKKAIDEFSARRAWHSGVAIFWGVCSIAAFSVLYVLANQYIDNFHYTISGFRDWTWQYVPFASLRIFTLSIFAGLAVFFMNMLKSQVHLYEVNSHKRLIASCFKSLSEQISAESSRDAIRAMLVQELINLGPTGMIGDQKDLPINGKLMDVLSSVQGSERSSARKNS